MAGYIEKGKIATINGSAATVVPCNEAGLVSAGVVVPWYLRGASGNLQKGTEVIYAIFEDQTGILLGRADGGGGECLPALTVSGEISCGGIKAGGIGFANHTHPVEEGNTETGAPK